MAPWETIFRSVWPDATLVWAIDPRDPVSLPSGVPTVSCDWATGRLARVVLDAMVTAAAEAPAAQWILKLDVDTAILSDEWLRCARGDSMLIGCQNGVGWMDMLGMAFALRREAMLAIHAGEDCNLPGPESGSIHRAARKRYLNRCWLWPHAPKSGGLFATMRTPEKAALYRQLFSVVHCGIEPRSLAQGLLEAFA